jgi:hypothetical protein
MKVLMKKLMYLILFYLVNVLYIYLDIDTVKGIIFIRDDIDDGKCGGTVKGIIFIRDDIDDGKCGGTVKGIIFISVLFYICFTVVALC